MASNTSQRVPMPQSNIPKQRKPKNRRRDVFRGNITGFIDVASNDGDVTAYSETVYTENAEDYVEPPEVPNPGRKTQNKASAAAQAESESSDDDGHSGAVFYGKISGFVKEARGTGNAIAMKKVIRVGSTRDNSLIETRGTNPVQQPQEGREIMESRNIIQGLNRPPMMIGANQPEKQFAQNRAGSQQLQDFNMGKLTEEFQALTPEMQRFIGSMARQNSQPMEDGR